MMGRRYLFISLLVFLILFPMGGYAETPVTSPPDRNKTSANDPAAELSAADLLDLLVTKGMITSAEADTLKQQAVDAAKMKKAAAKPAAPVYPNVSFKTRLEARISQVQRDEGQPYWGSRDDQYGGDGFALRRARFYMTGNLNPDISYNTIFSSDWGASSINLHVGAMEWKGWKDANLSAGILIVPFGWEIQANDAIYLQADLAAVSLLIPPDKDMGIRLDSKRPLFGKLHYQAMLANGSGRYVANPNHSYLAAARLYVQPAKDLTIGVSGSTNPNTDTSSYQSRFLKNNLIGKADPYGLLPAYTAKQVDEKMWGADFEWNHSHDTLRGEYMKLNIDRGSLGQDITADGYYLIYSRGLDYEGTPDKIELIGGIQGFDPNKHVKDKYDLTAYTLGLNYHISGSKRYSCTAGAQSCGSMLRLNYIWNHEAKDEVRNDKWLMQYQTWF
jgi:hypothetical protein